jgi:mRNA interferase RelE/StbE
MAYAVEILPSAKRQLERLHKKHPSDVITLYEAIFGLEFEQHPEGSKKLRGSAHLYRIRVGNYRIIYHLVESEVRVTVVKVGDRKDIYKADLALLHRSLLLWRKEQNRR